MGEVIKFARPKLKEQQRGKSLCKSGFHKWVAIKDQPFDVKRGKLLTRYRCERCGAVKTEAR